MIDVSQFTKLDIECSPEIAGKLTSLFQRGVQVILPGECSILDFLLGLPGFEDSYVFDKIQTIFHNGNAVDDVNATTLHSGDVLALSAAMPGLAGAIFRKGGIHATLRSKVSNCAKKQKSGSGVVTLKLFNMIAKERGPMLLGAGILLPGRQIADFLTQHVDYIKQFSFHALLDSTLLEYQSLITEASTKQVFILRVSAGCNMS